MDQRDSSLLACEENFHLGNWLVEPSTGRLINGSREARLEPKVMQVLVFLSKRTGRTVSRDDLIEHVWNGTIVSEDAVNRCISRLRRQFQSDSSVSIETLPKIGYRLITPVRPAEPVMTQAPPRATAVLAAGRRHFLRSNAGRAGLAVALLSVILLLGWFAGGSGTQDKTTAEFRVVPFTSLSGHEGMASFSPDGSHIAFTWRQPGKEPDVYIKPVGSEEMLRLTDNPAADWSPQWSPDGNRIAFARLQSDRAQLILTSPVGGVERQIASYPAAEGTELSWNPRGDSLAYSGQTEAGGVYRIMLVSATGASVRPLTYPPGSWIGDEYPCFSPDGLKLAFVRSRALGVSDIYLLDLDTGVLRPITFDNLKIHGLAWESGGRGLVFSSNRGGSFSLWRVDLDGRPPSPLPFGGRHADWVATSPAGDRLVYQEWMASCGLLRLDLTAKTAMQDWRLADSLRFDWDPELSPDGRRMAFLSDRSGSAEVWISDYNGNNRLQITSFGGPYTKTVKWSPDGRLLALTAPPAGHFDIFTADPNGGGVRRLTFDDADHYAPAWSPDGQGLYFSCNRSGRWEVWFMSRDGSHARQLTRQGGKIGLPSRDGKWLYFVKPDQPGIWKQALEGAIQEELVVSNLEPVDWNNWQVTPTGIYYVVRPGRLETFLRFYDFAAGRSTEVMELPRLHYDSGIDIAPDGRSLLISSVAKSESDLVLVQYQRPESVSVGARE